jgi:hypothetical protein
MANRSVSIENNGVTFLKVSDRRHFVLGEWAKAAPWALTLQETKRISLLCISLNIINLTEQRQMAAQMQPKSRE